MCKIAGKLTYIFVEKVNNALILYLTNSLCQVMTSTLNLVYFYFHVNMCGISYPS